MLRQPIAIGEIGEIREIASIGEVKKNGKWFEMLGLFVTMLRSKGE